MNTQTRPTAPINAEAVRAIKRIDYAFAAAEREQVAKVVRALGIRADWKPNKHLGDTPTHITMWTQAELNDVYERTGGTVTAREVQRISGSGSTWAATEITLTVDVPGVGYVELVTDWDEPTGGRDLPVMQQIADAELIAA